MKVVRPVDMNDLAQRLSKIDSLRGVLDTATDQLNAILTDAEKAIRNLRLGVSAEVSIDEYNKLGWRRYGQLWGLVVDHTRKDEVTTASLTNCTREVRLKSAHLLGELLSAMFERAETEIERVEAATKTASAFAANISTLGSDVVADTEPSK